MGEASSGDQRRLRSSERREGAGRGEDDLGDDHCFQVAVWNGNEG